MKNRLRIFLLNIFLLLGITASAYSYGLNNWYFDLDGDGDTSNAVEIYEFFDIVSPNVVYTTFANPTDLNYTFDNYGVVNAPSYDGGTTFASLGYDVTGKYNFSGHATLGGPIYFTDGYVEFYVNDEFKYSTTEGIYGADVGTKIATFEVVSGYGSVETDGLPNGDFSITYKAIDILENYFYMPDGATDMANFNTSILFVMGYTTTNASWFTSVNPTLAAELYEFSGLGPVSNIPPDSFFLSTNGQFRVDVVPEPATMLLLGIGLLGMGVVSRKKFLK